MDKSVSADYLCCMSEEEKEAPKENNTLTESEVATKKSRPLWKDIAVFGGLAGAIIAFQIWGAPKMGFG